MSHRSLGKALLLMSMLAFCILSADPSAAAAVEPPTDALGCSAQAWTAIYRNDETYSLELSDINEHWVIGPVQQWFLKSAELERSKTKDYAAYSEDRQAMDDRYPSCAVTPSRAQ